jgi:hypothetical protein
MTEKIMVTVTLQTEVVFGWIEFVTGGPEGFVDVFLGGHCGYWLEGINHEPALGWLAYEFGATDRNATQSEKEEATKAWLVGAKLPEHFHALNLETAKKSWAEGVKRDGLEWYNDGDGCTYDAAMQMALLGELVYA